MTEAPQGYRDVPEEDQQRAKAFFDKAKTVAETGQYDYAIAMFLSGLSYDPDSIEAHQSLRDCAMRRKAAGGKGLGMMDRMKMMRSSKDPKQDMLSAEKGLAYDPGNTDFMLQVLQNAYKAGFYDTCLWIAPILLKANAEMKNPDAAKYIALKDVYRDLKRFREAVEACQLAMRLKPDEMELEAELKNLGAQETMYGAGYAAGGNFRTTMRNKESQDQNIQQQKDVVSGDVMSRSIQDAEAEYARDSGDAAKLNRLVDALLRTEDFEYENRAIEVLEEAYGRTKVFAYRQRIGRIKMAQMSRMERSMRADAEANKKDEKLRQEYEQFRTEQIELELNEYQLWLEHYPTNLELKYELAVRMFALKRFDEAIPLFQQARDDPKKRVDGSIGLGRAFLEAGFVDEAVDTLQVVIDDYQLKGDDRSKLMYYWQGRAFEAKGTIDQALKRYSQVAQWEFTYKDVQQRIKKLRAGAAAK